MTTGVGTDADPRAEVSQVVGTKKSSAGEQRLRSPVVPLTSRHGEDRCREAVTLELRTGEVAVVRIPIVESEDNGSPRKIVELQPVQQFFEGKDVASQQSQ